MSLKDLIQQHASSVFLNPAHFAESITQHPGGSTDPESAITLTANVSYGLDPQSDTGRVNVQLNVNDQGRDLSQTADVTIPDSIAVSLKDSWTIDGLKYQTQSIGRPQGGLQIVRVKRVELVTRKTGYGHIQ